MKSRYSRLFALLTLLASGSLLAKDVSVELEKLFDDAWIAGF